MNHTQKSSLWVQGNLTYLLRLSKCPRLSPDEIRLWYWIAQALCSWWQEKIITVSVNQCQYFLIRWMIYFKPSMWGKKLNFGNESSSLHCFLLSSSQSLMPFEIATEILGFCPLKQQRDTWYSRQHYKLTKYLPVSNTVLNTSSLLSSPQRNCFFPPLTD